VALVLRGRKVGGLFTINADGGEVNDAAYAKLVTRPKQHVCSSRRGGGSTFARAILECARASHASSDIAQRSRPVGGIGACHVDDDAAGAWDRLWPLFAHRGSDFMAVGKEPCANRTTDQTGSSVDQYFHSPLSP